MKTIAVFVSMTLLSILGFSQTTNYEREIIATMRAQGYSVSTSQYADLVEGGKAHYWKTFYDDSEYAIVAFSTETGVYDVDIFLYDTDGTLLAKSDSEDDLEVVEYAPYTSRQMKVVIKNYDSYSSIYTYRIQFIVFYK